MHIPLVTDTLYCFLYTAGVQPVTGSADSAVVVQNMLAQYPPPEDQPRDAADPLSEPFRDSIVTAKLVNGEYKMVALISEGADVIQMLY